MYVLAVVGSPRKGKATDKLVDKAIEGVKFNNSDCEVRKIHLTDYDINYCRNCLEIVVLVHWMGRSCVGKGFFRKPEKGDCASPSPHHRTDADPGPARFGGTAADPVAALSVINVFVASSLHRTGDLCP